MMGDMLTTLSSSSKGLSWLGCGVLAAYAFVAPSVASAGTEPSVRLAPAFQNHAVLQRGRTIPVTGQAKPGDRVTVQFAEHTLSGLAGTDGQFRVELPPLEASSVGRNLTVRAASDESDVVLRDLLVGDVWLCSGQSNMEWSIGQLPDANAVISAANDPLIRTLKTPHLLSFEPNTSVPGTWVPVTGEVVRHCTAIGYHFAKDIRAAQGVPIGILDCSWGGTRIEPWIPPSGAALDGALSAARQATLDRRTGADEQARAPRPDDPCVMWNAMIAPLADFPVRGVAWYQGESNAGEPDNYRRFLPLMIDAWRVELGVPDLPFAVFQLASFMPHRPDLPVQSGWAELREAQRLGAAERNAGLVVLLDIGDAADIHPPQKAEAGRRLALWARATVYGESIPFSGPAVKEASLRDGAIVCSFDHATGLGGRGGEALRGFAIAGADGRFVRADAVVEGESIIVRSADVAQPVEVRYAWHNNPEEANLVNGAGLPASSFRAVAGAKAGAVSQ
jgi:sialate O-acetylesterase